MPLDRISRADGEVDQSAEDLQRFVPALSVQMPSAVLGVPGYSSSSCSVAEIGEQRRLSLAAVICSLAKSAVGAGSLFMPVCFHRLGLLGGLLVVLAAMGVNFVSLLLLSRACRRTRAADYLQLASVLGGPALEWIASLCLLLTILAPIVVSIKLTLAYLGSALSLLAGTPIGGGGYAGLFLTALVLWPMTLVQDGWLLARFSSLGMLGMLYVAVLCFCDLLGVSRGAFPEICLFNTSSTGQQVLGSVATILFSFSCHLTAPQILQDLQSPTLRRRGIVLASASALAAAFYIVIGVAGYLVFGPSVADDILTARPQSLPYAIGKLVLVAVNVLSFPLIAMPVKGYLQWAGEKATQSRGRTFSKRLYGHLSAGEWPTESTGTGTGTGASSLSFDLLQGAFIVALGVLLSTLFQSTGRVFDFIGSAFGAPIILILPAVFFSQSQMSMQDAMPWHDRLAVNCLILLGGFLTLGGLAFCTRYE